MLKYETNKVHNSKRKIQKPNFPPANNFLNYFLI